MIERNARSAFTQAVRESRPEAKGEGKGEG